MTLEMFKVDFSKLCHGSRFRSLLMHHLSISFKISLVWVSRADASVVRPLLRMYSMFGCLIRLGNVGLPLPSAGPRCLRFVAIEWYFQVDQLVMILSAVCLLAISPRAFRKLSIEPTLECLSVDQVYYALADSLLLLE